MINGEMNKEAKVTTSLQLINAYLNDRAERLFQPILAYLKEEADGTHSHGYCGEV